MQNHKLIGLIGWLPMMVVALPADQNAPIVITSKTFSANIATGVATYSGNVAAIQGSRRLNSNTLTITRDKDGKISSIVAHGNPATSQYQNQSNSPISHAKANVISYFPKQNLIEYQDNAVLEQNGNIFKGQEIYYNTVTQVVTSPQTQENNTTIILPASVEQKKT